MADEIDNEVLKQLFPGSDFSFEDGFSEIVGEGGTVEPKHFKSRWLYRYVRFADGRVLFCDACDSCHSHKTIADAYTVAPPVSAGKIEVRGKEWAIAEGGSTTLKLRRFDSDEKYIARELGGKFVHNLDFW